MNIKRMHSFTADISKVDIPHSFTYPFYYTPHPLCKLAMEQLQNYLTCNKWEHNFGLNQKNNSNIPIGKMFGVLIVRTRTNQLKQLWAYSGELLGENNLECFVPSIRKSETSLENGFLKEVSFLNQKIIEKENDIERLDLLSQLQQFQKETKVTLNSLQVTMKEEKRLRRIKRNKNPEDTELFDKLAKESIHAKQKLKEIKTNIRSKESLIKDKLDQIEQQINSLKNKRKEILQNLQERKLNQYQFKNYHQNIKSLKDIFREAVSYSPTAGSGDCCAPKLLQFAYDNDLKPIAMSEFWWGEAPEKVIRKHRQYYHACTTRCKPILGHMLQGLTVDTNPMLQNSAINKELKIIFEDSDIVIVNKPNGLLSVPGLIIKDSVESRMRAIIKNYNGPIIIHRLDQETSGIMIIAKNKKAHQLIQKQFIEKKIKKTYESILDGLVQSERGSIELPLTLDFNNRPAQMICFKNGKFAHTKFQVIKISNHRTFIKFFPQTGRTHQLRVHSAHKHGLNCPILGDDIYGNKADRLYLHAAEIHFTHPRTKEEMKFFCPSSFAVP